MGAGETAMTMAADADLPASAIEVAVRTRSGRGQL